MNVRTAQHRGFTLVETAVSLGVIGTLISLMLPAIGGSLDAARRAKCQANLRSIGQAFEMYLNENHRQLPFARWTAQSATGSAEPWCSLAAYLDAPLPAWDAKLGEATLSNPWACPEDPAAAMTGFSYDYAPASFFQVLDPDTRRRVSAWFVDDPTAVLALDARPVHPGQGHAAKNALRSDGSVAPFAGTLCRPTPR